MGEPVCELLGTGVIEGDGELDGVVVGGGLDGDGDGDVADELGDGDVADELGDGEVAAGELVLDDAELDGDGADDLLGEEHHEVAPACCGAADSVPMTPLEVWPGAIDWLTPGTGTTGGSPAAELWCAPLPAVPPGAAHRVAPLLDVLPAEVLPVLVVLSPLAPWE
jgi:hypothetical protein